MTGCCQSVRLIDLQICSSKRQLDPPSGRRSERGLLAGFLRLLLEGVEQMDRLLLNIGTVTI